MSIDMYPPAKRIDIPGFVDQYARIPLNNGCLTMRFINSLEIAERTDWISPPPSSMSPKSLVEYEVSHAKENTGAGRSASIRRNVDSQGGIVQRNCPLLLSDPPSLHYNQPAQSTSSGHGRFEHHRCFKYAADAALKVDEYLI
jgi:hypothetical protein